MISTLFDDSTTESRCLALVAFHGPKLMKCGGGMLDSREHPAVVPLTENERARIVALARANPSAPPSFIAAQVGRSPVSIRRTLRAAGIQTPYLQRLAGAGKLTPQAC